MPAHTSPSIRVGFIALVAFVLAAAGCSSDSPEQQPAPAQAQPEGHTTHTTTSARPQGSAAPKPEQVRASFEQLLGRHCLLAVRLMRTGVFGAPDVRRATQAAVSENTTELRRTVASTYGDPAAERFAVMWQGHLDHLSAYAGAAGKRDAAARQQAADQLIADAEAYGTWMANSSKGKVTAAAATSNMRHHVDNLIQQTDAYASRDYATAYRLEREAYEHMWETGTRLAKGSLAPEQAARLDAAPDKMRSAFAMLLSEHMELVIDAQRATFAGAPEFKAAADQVNANSAALVAAMGAIVGPEKGAQFEHEWAEHVEELMAYTAAVADRDPAAGEEAQDELSEYATDLARYFSDIVENRLALGTLLGVLTLHDRHLTDHVDAYAARDFSTATKLELEGYRHMHGVADTLVTAIQRTLQPGLPVGGAQTGGGGTATSRR